MNQNKVALYCRLSVEEKESLKHGGESESIQNQKMILLEYAKKNQWMIYDIYCDEDYSGLTEERPAFLQMMQDAQRGCFQIILCKTQSRFTRNIEIAEKYFHHYFLQWGIRFIAVLDHIDTAMKGNKKERQILGLVNEWYCEEISENIRLVFDKKRKTGQFIGNFAPYGYLKNPNDRHSLLIDEEAAKIVRHIFQRYTEKGYSCKAIAEELTNQKVPTPWQRKIERGEDLGRKNVKHPNVWAETTIRKMLHNRVYLGDMVQGREEKLSYKEQKVKSLPQKNWIIVHNTHEPIISEEAFQEAQNKKRRKK